MSTTVRAQAPVEQLEVGAFTIPTDQPEADGTLATMGPGVPYAIAAKFAYPSRPVVAMVGDGAMQMNTMAELITVAKYWREWASPTWICGVFSNESLNPGTWEQRVLAGDPGIEASQRIPNVPYHRFADLIGLKGLYVDDPELVGPAWESALAADCPVLIEFKTDPEVPPLPPHITGKQAKAFASALAKGDPAHGHVLLETARGVFASILAGRE